MAGITQTLCTSFKVQLMGAGHNFSATPRTAIGNQFGQDIFFIALYSLANGAALDATTTAYDPTGTLVPGEISGPGYFAGGAQLVVSQVPTSAGMPTTTAFINFFPVSWGGASPATFSADGALIYNQSNSNAAVGVLNFGGTKSVANGTFTIQFPAAGVGSSIIQIA